MLNNVDLIRRVPLFSQLTQSQASLLAKSVGKQEYKRGDVMLQQGEISNTLSILLRGRARVVMTNREEREVILAVLRAGDYIGEMSLIDGQAHSASVIAEASTDVLVLSRQEFMACLAANNALAFSVMEGLVARLRIANRKIGSLALTGVYARVANVLFELAQEDSAGQLIIKGKVSRKYVAQLVGASREMVGRTMRIFEENGFIQVNPDGSTRLIERRLTPR